MKKWSGGLFLALTIGGLATVWAVDGECAPPRCSGLGPTFVTETIADMGLGKDVIVPLKLRGNNEGSYFSFSGLWPKQIKKTRTIHIALPTDEMTKQQIRDVQDHLGINFGRCSVEENVTTCELVLRAKKDGAVLLPIRAIDECQHNDCPTKSGKTRWAFSVKTYSFRITH